MESKWGVRKGYPDHYQKEEGGQHACVAQRKDLRKHHTYEEKHIMMDTAVHTVMYSKERKKVIRA